MSIFYDLIFSIVVIFYLPVYLLHGKFHRGFLQRLGFLTPGFPAGSVIWLHAVSVGEVMAVRGLLDRLRESFPGKKLILSTVTATGNKVAGKLLREGDALLYLPLDFSFIVGRFIQKTQPAALILAETELWPNLISCLYKHRIPIIVVNGRISDRSFKGYRLARFFLRPLLNKITLFCVQSQRDRERLTFLGASPEKIRVTGNMKFDAAGGIPKGKDSFPGRREVLGLAEGEKMLLAASTHPGEEEIILSAYKSLLGVHPELRLLIAPRHPERSAEVCRIVEGAGFLPVRISSLDRQTERPLPAQRNYGQAGADRKTVFILDTIGEMVDYYAICDIAFVGGSLVKKGGHNILEPAAFAKPIICGTQMFNFRDIAELFVSSGAFKLVRGEKEFREAVACFLEDPQAARLTGERARQLLEHNRGATLRTAEAIREYFIP